MSDKDEITITLSKDTALVLFEFGCRVEELKLAVAIALDKGERGAVSELLGKLESTLVEPLAKNYKELVSQAKEKCKRRLYGDDV